MEQHESQIRYSIWVCKSGKQWWKIPNSTRNMAQVNGKTFSVE